VREEVIVAAGAVDSPKLLMLSGIGPAHDLERLGIAVRADLPGVGQNLHDHLAATATYEATRPVPPGRNQNSEAGLYCRSDPGAPHYDLQFAFLHIPFLAPGFTCGPHGFTLFGGILKVLSRGSIALRSADPADPPLIDPAYLKEEADVQRMLVALEIGRDIASAPAFDDWRGRAVAPDPGVQSEADKRSYLAASGATFFHPVGTCKMGTETTAWSILGSWSTGSRTCGSRTPR
jgi:choline dehydrogenase